MRYLVFGYQHNKYDSYGYGTRLVPKKWHQSWGQVFKDDVDIVNSKEDLKHQVIITFVTKL